MDDLDVKYISNPSPSKVQLHQRFKYRYL